MSYGNEKKYDPYTGLPVTSSYNPTNAGYIADPGINSYNPTNAGYIADPSAATTSAFQMSGTQGPQTGTPMMDKFKMGIGGVNALMGILGTFDAMKTNKLQRKGMEQNQKHARMARADRTSFLTNTHSAFA